MFLFTISLLSSKPVLAVKIGHGFFFFFSIFKMRSQSRLLVCTTAQQKNIMVLMQILLRWIKHTAKKLTHSTSLKVHRKTIANRYMKIAQFLILKKMQCIAAKKKKPNKSYITLTSPFKELFRVNNPINYYVHVSGYN